MTFQIWNCTSLYIQWGFSDNNNKLRSKSRGNYQLEMARNYNHGLGYQFSSMLFVNKDIQRKVHEHHLAPAETLLGILLRIASWNDSNFQKLALLKTCYGPLLLTDGCCTTADTYFKSYRKQWSSAVITYSVCIHIVFMYLSIFTSVLFGKNQHKTPTKLPNTTPINSSIGPLKMLNTMFPKYR